jgi:hypothetical protein
MAQTVRGGKGWTTIGNERRSGARNWRNHNPGNIEYGPFARSFGAIGTDGRFAVFPDYETGRRAKAGLLFDSKGYRNKTIFGAISRYAPEFENDTMGYARAVAKSLGVSINTKLSDLSQAQRDVMLDAMQRVEGWKKGTVSFLDGIVRPQKNEFPAAPLAPPPSPALSYLPTPEPVAPTPPSALAPTNNSMSPALGAIEAIAPTPPSGSIIGQPVDMSRFAPQNPQAPTGLAAAAQAPYGALGVDPNAVDTNFGGIAPSSMPGFGGTFPGLSMPATPTGPSGAETLFAKAQAPSVAQGPVPPSLPPAPPPSPLMSPMSLAQSMPTLTAPEFNVFNQQPTALGLQMAPSGIGALPAFDVPTPANLQQPPSPPPMDQIQTAAFPTAPPAPPQFAQEGTIGTIGGNMASGGNTIGMDANGIRTVTNQFGVTTGTLPDGKQTAYGPGPNLGNLFGGVKMSDKTKGMLAGAALGALAGGLPGAVAGGLFGRALSNNRNSFPAAPGRHGERNGVPGGDRTHAERASRSPSAADHVSRGGSVTGLW